MSVYCIIIGIEFFSSLIIILVHFVILLSGSTVNKKKLLYVRQKYQFRGPQFHSDQEEMLLD